MGKNIVVCYDGTNKEHGEYNTNVVKTFEAIVRDDTQVAFYDPGVGTFSYLGRKLGRQLGILMGLAFGYGIRQNIEDGYEYLMNRFQPGDRVFIFGFSRGAYTARALAGMIHYFGILQKGSKNLIPYVSKMYFQMNRKKEKKSRVYAGFKRTFSHVCKPHFIGIWDTVSALGPNLSKKFPDQKLNTDIKYGFHAIAIDERRRPYKVVLWDEPETGDDQIIEQVWFAGAHSDVGGGFAHNESALSDIALAWMLDKASDCGLELRKDWKSRLNLQQNARGKIHHASKLSWIIFGWPVRRKIPEGTKEAKTLIHQSVIDRMRGKDSYKPSLPEHYSVVSTVSYRQ